MPTHIYQEPIVNDCPLNLRSPKPRRQRGQSLVEIAITAPVLVLLLFAVVIVSILISDRVVSGYAVRQGARVGAMIGGLSGNPCPGANCVTQATADQTIVKNVLTVVGGLHFASVTEIDIYPATCAPASSASCQAAGMYGGSTNPIDQWGPNDQPLSGGQQTFTMDKRMQVVPQETSIGVRVYYQFRPPANIGILNQSVMDYAVMKAAPVIT
jgi:hypothetical protein